MNAKVKKTNNSFVSDNLSELLNEVQRASAKEIEEEKNKKEKELQLKKEEEENKRRIEKEEKIKMGELLFHMEKERRQKASNDLKLRMGYIKPEEPKKEEVKVQIIKDEKELQKKEQEIQNLKNILRSNQDAPILPPKNHFWRNFSIGMIIALIIGSFPIYALMNKEQEEVVNPYALATNYPSYEIQLIPIESPVVEVGLDVVAQSNNEKVQSIEVPKKVSKKPKIGNSKEFENTPTDILDSKSSGKIIF